jgi:hypothetical protein
VERIFLVTDDDRMSGVIAALVAHDIVDTITQDIGGFAFAFIAPLGTKQNNCWHLKSLSPENFTCIVV